MMSRLYRIACTTAPWRWVGALLALTHGVRRDPTTLLLGSSDRIRLGPGVVLGARVRIDAGESGRVVAGQGVWLAADTEVETAGIVKIGDGTTIQRRGSINGNVSIGRSCILAPNVFVSSGTHPFRVDPALFIREQERLLARRGEGNSQDRPVWIQDDCWLGVNAVVCPGVTVGKGSIVGANAVVTHDVAPYSVVGGAPARRIGGRLDWSPPTVWHADRSSDRIYALQSRPDDIDGPGAMSLDGSEPLCVVLSAELRGKIQVVVDIDRPMAISAGGQRFDLPRGTTTVEIAVERLPLAWGGRLVEVSMAEGHVPRSGRARVSRIGPKGA